jgi:hypothetical protein
VSDTHTHTVSTHTHTHTQSFEQVKMSLNRRKFKAFGGSKRGAFEEEEVDDYNDDEEEQGTGRAKKFEGDIGGEEDDGNQKVHYSSAF